MAIAKIRPHPHLYPNPIPAVVNTIFPVHRRLQGTAAVSVTTFNIIIIVVIIIVMTSSQRSSGTANDRKRPRTNAAEDEANATSNANAAAAAAAAARHSKNKRKSSKGAADPVLKRDQSRQMTAYGLAVLVAAVAVGLVWNRQEAALTDPLIRALWSAACHPGGGPGAKTALCGRTVQPTRRTLKATRPVRPGERLVEIPRSLQLWEVDALRHPFLQGEGLLEARHGLTGNPLAGGAILAAYLALEQRRLLAAAPSPGNGRGGGENGTASARTDGKPISAYDPADDRLRTSYLRSLPSREGLGDHPLLWPRDELRSALGVHSWTYAVVMMYGEMVGSEYDAFSEASAAFASQIGKEEYETARIHVLTRSFNPGPEGCLADEEHLSPEERKTLQAKLGMEEPGMESELFAEGCHAMVPFLDMLNHHPKPNVAYKYEPEKQAFVISAKTNIPPQWELMDSYGKFSDSHLFAKFGFVNGDGSGYTQASIALFHRPLDIEMKHEFTLLPFDVQKQLRGPTSSTTKMLIPDFQQAELKRYLQYDDGYYDCVQKDLHPEAFAFKELKWKHLAKIANNPKHWIVTVHPRSPESSPLESSDLRIADEPPQIDPLKLRTDITHLVETCRLLALTVDDFDGTAAELLRDDLASNSFVVPRGNAALEYRALMFLARLASTSLKQFTTNLRDQFELVTKLNLDAFGSREWTAAHLRLGEMQSLHALTNVALGHARALEEDAITDPDPATFYIRELSCPKEYTDILKEDAS